MDIWSKKKIIPSFSSIPKDPIILCYMIHLLKFFFQVIFAYMSNLCEGVSVGPAGGAT